MREAVILGRQPKTLHITPSSPNSWYGSIIPGERFTAEQLNALRRSNKDPATVESLLVKRNASDREYYWGTGQVPPQFHFECPVLSRRPRDGAVTVIAPAGWSKVVRSDGWVGAPGKPKGIW